MKNFGKNIIILGLVLGFMSASSSKLMAQDKGEKKADTIDCNKQENGEDAKDKEKKEQAKKKSDSGSQKAE